MGLTSHSVVRAKNCPACQVVNGWDDANLTLQKIPVTVVKQLPGFLPGYQVYLKNDNSRVPGLKHNTVLFNGCVYLKISFLSFTQLLMSGGSFHLWVKFYVFLTNHLRIPQSNRKVYIIFAITKQLSNVQDDNYDMWKYGLVNKRPAASHNLDNCPSSTGQYHSKHQLDNQSFDKCSNQDTLTSLKNHYI